jgi:Cdc6-like AAA superfamily ATPase
MAFPAGEFAPLWIIYMYEHLRDTIVGRENELKVIRNVLDSVVLRGERANLIVMGNAGWGKSMVRGNAAACDC